MMEDEFLAYVGVPIVGGVEIIPSRADASAFVGRD